MRFYIIGISSCSCFGLFLCGKEVIYIKNMTFDMLVGTVQIYFPEVSAGPSEKEDRSSQRPSVRLLKMTHASLSQQLKTPPHQHTGPSEGSCFTVLHKFSLVSQWSYHHICKKSRTEAYWVILKPITIHPKWARDQKDACYTLMLCMLMKLDPMKTCWSGWMEGVSR